MSKHLALVFSVWLTFMLVSCSEWELPQNIKQDVAKHVEAENAFVSSRLQKTVTDVEIVKSSKATPTKEFLAEYNPKSTCCVSCRYEMETFERGKPPEKYSLYDDFVVLTTQSGETAIITHVPVSASMSSADKKSAKLPKVLRQDRRAWSELWAKNCPYKPLESKRK